MNAVAASAPSRFTCSSHSTHRHGRTRFRKFQVPRAGVGCSGGTKMLRRLLQIMLLLQSCFAFNVAPQRARDICMNAPEQPLSLLKKLAATDKSLLREVNGFEAAAAGKKYCKYDDIRATLAASRARSRDQGRKGCCSKSADYLGATGPPPDSPWGRTRDSD